MCAAEYGISVALGLVESQASECTRMLVELLKNGPRYLREKGFVGEDEVFYTQLNALLVRDAEQSTPALRPEPSDRLLAHTATHTHLRYPLCPQVLSQHHQWRQHDVEHPR